MEFRPPTNETSATVTDHVILKREALKNLLPAVRAREKQILRFAQDDDSL